MPRLAVVDTSISIAEEFKNKSLLELEIKYT